MSAAHTNTPTRLIIARHGNTFGKGDTPTRVGARTDLPLVEKGFAQGRALGLRLKQDHLLPDLAFTSELTRTQQTAQAALEAANLNITTTAHPLFNEIDYGPDENKTEDDVIARIGEEAIKEWDSSATAPAGWVVDVEAIKQGWQDFAQECLNAHQGKTILIVTSNGTARFAPVLCEDAARFTAENNIKLSTGAFGVFEHNGNDGEHWTITQWNEKPVV